MNVKKFRKACATVHWFAQDSVVELSPGIEKLQLAIMDWENGIINIQCAVNLYEIESRELQSKYEKVDNLNKKIKHNHILLKSLQNEIQKQEQSQNNQIKNIEVLITEIDRNIKYASKHRKYPKQKIDNLNKEKKISIKK
jgi:predicted RNase H-like nuclease (RuvC/YqgF family)